MTPDIERAARAAFEVDEKGRAHLVGHSQTWEQVGEQYRYIWIDRVTAALTALAEPSNATVRLACQEYSLHSRGSVYPESMRAALRAANLAVLGRTASDAAHGDVVALEAEIAALKAERDEAERALRELRIRAVRWPHEKLYTASDAVVAWAKRFLQKWRASAEAPDGDGEIEWDYLVLMLDAARKEALEEAARWHEAQIPILSGLEYRLASPSERATMRLSAWQHDDYAIAIRSLIDKPPAPPADGAKP